MVNNKKLLSLICTATNIIGQQPDGNESPDYYAGFDAGKSAALYSVMRQIASIVEGGRFNESQNDK